MTIPCCPASHTYAPYDPPSGLRWMVFAGFAGDPNIVFCLSDDRTKVYYDSPLGRAAAYGDAVTTIGHPEPQQFQDYLDAIVVEITGPTILFGLSTGGQLAERVFQAAVQAGKLHHVFLVLGSTPETLAMLRPGLATAVRLLSHLPAILVRPVLSAAAPFSVHWHAVRTLRETHRRRVLRLSRESFRRSVWIPNAMRLLLNSPGFGPTVVRGACVATLNLHDPTHDNVIDPPAAVEAAKRAYPDLIPLIYDGHHHGEYELDARLIQDALDVVRRHALAHFDIRSQ